MEALEKLTTDATALAQTALPTLVFDEGQRLMLLTKIEEFIMRGVMMSNDFVYSAALIAVGFFFLASTCNSSSSSAPTSGSSSSSSSTHVDIASLEITELQGSSSAPTSGSSSSSSSTQVDIASLEITELQGYIRLSLIHFTTDNGSAEMQASNLHFQDVFNVPPEIAKTSRKATAKEKEAANEKKVSFQSGSGHFCVSEYCLRYLIPCGTKAELLKSDVEGAYAHANEFAVYFLHCPGLAKLYDVRALQETYEAFLSSPAHIVSAVTVRKVFMEKKLSISAFLTKRLDIATRFCRTMWESESQLEETYANLEAICNSIFLRKSFKSK